VSNYLNDLGAGRDAKTSCGQARGLTPGSVIQPCMLRAEDGSRSVGGVLGATQ
jgi:hypothetical protein